jgi:hypothetical protein
MTENFNVGKAKEDIKILIHTETTYNKYKALRTIFPSVICVELGPRTRFFFRSLKDRTV